MRAYTDDELRMIAAWSDYRKEYGISGDSTWVPEGFIAGWNAARDNTVDNTRINEHYWAGFDAYSEREG